MILLPEVFKPWDSIYYDSNIPHVVSCHVQEPVRIVAVILPGEEMMIFKVLSLKSQQLIIAHGEMPVMAMFIAGCRLQGRWPSPHHGPRPITETGTVDPPFS